MFIFLFLLNIVRCQNDTMVIVHSEMKKNESIHSSTPEDLNDTTSVEFYDFGSYEEIVYFMGLFLKNYTKGNKSQLEVGLVGPTHSDSAYGVAHLIQKSGSRVKHFHTSFLPTALESEVRGKSTYRILPPVDILADACVALIKYVEWSTVLTFYQDTHTDMKYMFMRYQAALRTHADHVAIDSLNRAIPVGSLAKSTKIQADELQKFFLKYSSRVFILMLDGRWASKLICLAFKLKMRYPVYQWVILKTKLEEIIFCNDGAECSSEEIVGVLTNAIFIGFRFNEPFSVYEYGIKAMAQTLNSSSSLGERYFEQVAAEHFPEESLIQQLLYGILQPVLVYSSNNLVPFIGKDIVSISSTFKVQYYVNSILGAVVLVVNFVTLLVCLSLHILTVIHRHKGSVKKNSPLLLHILYIGTYCVNVASIVYTVQASIPIASDVVYVVLCQVFWLVMSVGTTILLGSLLVKSWRLYRIFVYYLNPGEFITNKALILITFLLCLVDIVICTLWFILDPIKRFYTEISRDIISGSVTYFAGCRSRTSLYTVGTLSSYQVLLFLVMITLLVKARAKMPRTHLKLHSLMENLLGYIVLVSIFLCILTYVSTVIFGLPIIVEVVGLSLLFILVQYCCIRLILLPPLLPVICSHKHLSSSLHWLFTS